MDELVVWLGAEGRQGAHLRGWTPDHTERFADLASGDPGLAARCDPRSLVDGSETRALEAVLPAPLAIWLAARLRQTPRLSLRLSTDLPAAWQRFPYEWLTLDGQPLHDRLRVWRHVPRTAEPVPPARTAPVALLNLWPGDAAVQPLADLAVSPVDAHRYDGRRWVEAPAAHAGPARLQRPVPGRAWQRAGRRAPVPPAGRHALGIAADAALTPAGDPAGLRRRRW